MAKTKATRTTLTADIIKSIVNDAMGICLFCRQEKQLIKAHIYPEWVFRGLYPEGVVDNNEPLIVVSTSNPYSKRRPIGIWDDNILCSECDGYLGRVFDSRGKKYLMDTTPSLYKKTDDDKGAVFTLPEVNPIVLKNFIISVMLRSAWSQKEEYLHVSFPEKFINRMVDIVRDNSSTALGELSVFITKFKSEKLKYVSERYSQVPYRTRIDGVNFWILNFPNGYKIYIKIDGRDYSASMEPFCLREGYPVYVPQWENFEDSRELRMLTPHLGKVMPKSI